MADVESAKRDRDCQCTWEHGDSACDVHPSCANCGELNRRAAATYMRMRDEVAAIRAAARAEAFKEAARVCDERAADVHADISEEWEATAIAKAIRALAADGEGER